MIDWVTVFNIFNDLQYPVYIIFVICVVVEPEYDFEKPLSDADAYEKETAEFECEVNDEEANVDWYREDKVILGHIASLHLIEICEINVWNKFNELSACLSPASGIKL